jgi:raffinose/stachyose/melibiose transport system permease protein
MSFRNPRRVWRVSSAVLVALIFVIPIGYVILISFDTASQFIQNPLTPSMPTIQNFSQAWDQGNLGPEVVNTVLYAVVAAAVSTGLSLLIAFPIARRLVRHSSLLFKAFVIGLCFPLPIIPLFIESRMFGLYDNRLGYIVLHVEMGLPLGVILLSAFVSSIPKELDEAAWLDGFGYMRYIVSVIGPLAWPSLVITFLYSLLAVWNDIIGPLVFLATPSLYPVTRGVYNFYGSNESAWTLLTAAVVIVSLPVAALFAASQRQLLRSTMGVSA